MKDSFAICACFSLIASIAGYEVTIPVVETAYGPLRGSTKYSRLGREYDSFTGIPYAKPPVEELRFAAPQPPDPWHPWILNATKKTPLCSQRNYLFSNNPPIEGQEDCLYMNVFVPRVNCKIVKLFTRSGRQALLPVLVNIPWGGFIAGGSKTGFLGPDYLMDKDVILVTFNYRLGPFGFLSTLDDTAPGNWALKDQVLALKWIQENIEFFGGDKNRVTLSGQSAGAGSTHLHMLSPSSKGLFHQAITQSGSALALWAKPFNQLALQATLAQAQFVGCTNLTNSATVIKCLRQVPVEGILKTQDLFRPFYGDPLAVFPLVTETKTKSNPDPFLTKTPLEYVMSGEFSNIPWIAGNVADEGLVRAANRICSKKIRDAINANFSTVLPELLLLSVSTSDVQGLYQNITEEYLGGHQYINVSDKNSVEGFIDAYSDRSFLYSHYQGVMLHAAMGQEIHLYSFEYKGKYTYETYLAATRETIDFNFGTSHCDDLLYLYSSADLFPPITGNDYYLSIIMVDLWTNFVIRGNPNPPQNLILEGVTWKPFKINQFREMSNDNIHLLNITGNYRTGANFAITRGFYKERMRFWEESDLLENFDGLH